MLLLRSLQLPHNVELRQRGKERRKEDYTRGVERAQDLLASNPARSLTQTNHQIYIAFGNNLV